MVRISLSIARSLVSILVILCLLATVPAAGYTSPHCVSLGWIAPGDDGHTGTVATYEIRYSTSCITECTWNQADIFAFPPEPLPAGAWQQVTISGLKANTTYYFALRSADECGNWSALSNVVAYKTPLDECNGIRGNVDCDPDDVINIQDLVLFVDFLFGGNQPVCICMNEADVNDNPGGQIDISDLVYLVDFFFAGVGEMPRCP